MRTVVAWLLVGCTQRTSPTSTLQRRNAAAAVSDDRCGMIEAALQHEQIKSFACGTAATEHGRLIVDVSMQPPLRTPCTSDRFTIYRADQPMNTDALLQLGFKQEAHDVWSVQAMFIDPPGSPDDEWVDGGFEDVSYYCFVMGVRVSRTNRGWRASDDDR